jgi:putative spermidine/putrescine transport system substrate-binding protein
MVLAALAAGCGSGSAGVSDTNDAASALATAPDRAAVADAIRAGEFKTYGIPDSWGGYGGMVQAFCEDVGVPDCTRTDTDTDSAETVRRFGAERNNPGAVVGGVGVTFMNEAAQQGVLLDYLPEQAQQLPEWARVPGGFVTYTGAIAFVVNTDVVPNPPRTWSDLERPEYEGLVGVFDPRESATGLYTLLAANAAMGGDVDNLEPGLAYFRRLREQGILAANRGDATTMERGEVPIQITRDFQGVQTREALAGKGVSVEVRIPQDGSIYAPDSLVLNRFAEPNDIGRAFAEFVLSDAGQIEYARFGSRPIRAVLGDLEVPAEARELWLPDDQYGNVEVFTDWEQISSAEIAELWEQHVLS